MPIAEVSIVPIGTGTTSVSHYVAACLQILDASGLPYELHGMGTIIEGTMEELFSVIGNMHEVPFSRGAARVVTHIKLDDRRDRQATSQDKVASVLSKKKTL